MISETGRYIEIECPACSSDFKVLPVSEDSGWICPKCGAEHLVGDVGMLFVPGHPQGEWMATWPNPRRLVCTVCEAQAENGSSICWSCLGRLEWCDTPL